MSKEKQKKSNWLIISCLAILLAAGAVTGFWYLYYQNQRAALCPQSGELNVGSDCSADAKTFIIKKGEGPILIASNLEAAGLIRKALIFRLELKRQGVEEKLQAGVFKLSAGMTLDEIIAELIDPPEEVSITVLPGWRREEFASYLAGLGLINFDQEEFLELTVDREGFLWADTYRVFADATAKEIVQLLEKTFETKTRDLQEEALAKGRDWEEIVIIASILQREARNADQMKMIAQIFQNRLEIDMRLQLCATAQYATGYNAVSKSWWDEPALADTEFLSPFNTYVTAGLPPRPIAAVSRMALEAALNPTDNNYLFYLHDSEGKIHYGRTAEEHNRNKANFLN